MNDFTLPVASLKGASFDFDDISSRQKDKKLISSKVLDFNFSSRKIGLRLALENYWNAATVHDFDSNGDLAE